MKKVVAVFLTVILITMLFGCAGPSASVDGTQTSPVNDPTGAAAGNGADAQTPADNAGIGDSLTDESGNGQIIIKVENTDIERFYAPDKSGNLILSYICEKPVVEIENSEYASDVINNYFNDMDEEYHTGEKRGLGNVFCPGKNQMLQMATDNYQYFVYSGEDLPLELIFSHYVDIVRCDMQVISFVFTDYIFDGTGSGEFCKYALSFDSFSGKLIDLTEHKDFAKIRKIVNGAIADYAELSYEKGSCFLTRDGLSFLVRSDVVSEDGSLYKTVTVPYSAFTELDEPFFTVSERAFTGDVSISDSAMDHGDTVIIDRVDVRADGEQYFLIVDGTVCDIKLVGVQYSNYDEVFYSKNLYWMTNYLSDCRLQLSLVIPEGMPDVMICYSTEGREYSKFISQSGLDGKVLLVDDSISALG